MVPKVHSIWDFKLVYQRLRALQSATIYAVNMSSKVASTITFEPRDVIQPIYTGGDVALDSDGRILVTCLAEDALLTDVNSGLLLARVEGVR